MHKAIPDIDFELGLFLFHLFVVAMKTNVRMCMHRLIRVYASLLCNKF